MNKRIRIFTAMIIVTTTLCSIAIVNQRVAQSIEIGQVKQVAVPVQEEVQIEYEAEAQVVKVVQPVKTEETKKVNKPLSRGGSGLPEASNDLMLLAKLIESEAGIESYAGKLAVGTVVMNRVDSKRYPNSIKEVVYQKGQFDGVGSDEWNRQPSDDSIKAAKEVLAGYRTFGKQVIYYYNPEISSDSDFINSIAVVSTIGRHSFAQDK